MQHVVIFYSVMQICLIQVTVNGTDEGSTFFRLLWVYRYLGPISTSFSPQASASFGVSDSGSTCSGGRNNQRRTSFCSALRLLQPAGESRRTQGQRGRTDRRLWSSGCVRSLYTSVSFKPLGLLRAHLSTPHCSTAQWWLTAAGRAWLPSVRLSSPQPHHCRTAVQPCLN